MSQVKMTRTSMMQTLTAAFEGILDLFERTIENYEEQLRQSKEENRRHHSLLDAAFSPVVRLHRLDVRQLMEKKEEMLSTQQVRSSSLNQETPAEPAQIKEEQEEEWSTQERQQLQEPEEADMKLDIIPLQVKSEYAEETLQFFQIDESQSEEYSDIEHLKTEADVEECGGSEPELVESVTHETSYAGSEDNNSLCDWEQTFKTLSVFNPLQNTVEPLKDIECGSGNAPLSFSECAISFKQNVHPQETTAVQNTARPISCPFCGEVFFKGFDLKEHLKVHRKKQFSCSLCPKRFKVKEKLEAHMRIHRENSMFSYSDSLSRQQALDLRVTTQSQANQYPCEVCNMSFICKNDLDDHSKIHIEGNFTCTVCGKIMNKISLKSHMTVHTGESTHACTVCGKSFAKPSALKIHVRVHTGEKPFCCAVCSRGFGAKADLVDHMRIHTGEKPYSCTVCGQTFRVRQLLAKHMRTQCSSEEVQMQCV